MQGIYSHLQYLSVRSILAFWLIFYCVTLSYALLNIRYHWLQITKWQLISFLHGNNQKHGFTHLKIFISLANFSWESVLEWKFSNVQIIVWVHIPLSHAPNTLLWLGFYYFNEVWLIRSVTLISGIWHSGLTTHYFMYVHHKCSYHPSPYSTVKMLLTIVPLLYILSHDIYCITGSSYLPFPFTQFVQSPNLVPSGNHHFFFFLY